TTTCLILPSFCRALSGAGFGFGLWCFGLWCFGGGLCAAAPPCATSNASRPATSASTANKRRGIGRPSLLSTYGLPNWAAVPLRPRTNRVVHAPLSAEGLAELADRAVGAERLAE